MWCGVVWCVCRTGIGVFAVQTRMNGIDEGKTVCDGTKVPIKTRRVRVAVC